jgi:hypothetical protein
LRALSLVSIAPIQTACGAYHVYVTLGGKQRVTMMSIYRTQENGGSFVAPLAVDTRMTFIPVRARSKGARTLELARGLTFPPRSLPWTLTASAQRTGSSPVVVDTDGDFKADTVLPGTSNFSSGHLAENRTLNKLDQSLSCCPVCHEDGGCQHCYVPYNCGNLCSDF